METIVTRDSAKVTSGNSSGRNSRARNDIFDDSRRAIILQPHDSGGSATPLYCDSELSKLRRFLRIDLLRQFVCALVRTRPRESSFCAIQFSKIYIPSSCSAIWPGNLCFAVIATYTREKGHGNCAGDRAVHIERKIFKNVLAREMSGLSLHEWILVFYGSILKYFLLSIWTFLTEGVEAWPKDTENFWQVEITCIPTKTRRLVRHCFPSVRGSLNYFLVIICAVKAARSFHCSKLITEGNRNWFARDIDSSRLIVNSSRPSFNFISTQVIADFIINDKRSVVFLVRLWDCPFRACDCLGYFSHVLSFQLSFNYWERPISLE